MQNGFAYSLPCEDPTTFIEFDTAKEYCEAKGVGWHLPTLSEWAAIALWCQKNDTMPKGNNNYGKDATETDYKAIPTTYESDGRTCQVATGTGPLTWSHSGTGDGIWDLNGNCYEWLGGYRIVQGEVQIIANNDAADVDNLQNSTSPCWKAIDAATGVLVTPGADNTVKLDYVDGKWIYSTTITSQEDSIRSCAFKEVTSTEDVGPAVLDTLRVLAMFPSGGLTDDAFLANNGGGERLIARGGRWSSGTGGGVFNADGSSFRANTTAHFGFRSAYIENYKS